LVQKLYTEKTDSLAWCELYLILGTTFRKLDMTLREYGYVH